MCRGFVLLALLGLAHLEGTACFKLSITRNLNTLKELDKELWIGVEVTGTNLADDESDGDVTVKFDIPKALSFSDALVFFANDAKEILQVNLKSKIKGKFYSTPHKLEKELEGGETTVEEKEKTVQLTGRFPIKWLPKNYNKMSATVLGNDDQYYNYYKIQNFKISLPDLMVLEEYKSFEFI